jgi:hypothetical protein
MKFSIVLAGTVLFGFMSSVVKAISTQASSGIGGSSDVWNTINVLANKYSNTSPQSVVKTTTKSNNLSPPFPSEFGDNYVLPQNNGSLEIRLANLKIPKK